MSDSSTPQARRSESANEAPRPRPIVLVDGGDDGMYDWGWVEATATATEALALMAPMNPDPDCCVVRLVQDGQPTTYLRPERPSDPETPWTPCSRSAKTARRFWRLELVERDDLEGDDED